MEVEARLAEMGLPLLEVPSPLGNYVGAVRVGNLLFVSGHGPRRLHDDSIMAGKVGRDLTTEQAYEVAKSVMLNCLASVKREIGDLDRVKRIVKLLGMVNCTETFTEHPQVMNGASDLMVEVLGDKGRHTRVAVGVSSLPLGCAVEVDAVIVIED